MTIDQDYLPVCRLDDLEVERGVAALVHGQAIALFRTPDGAVHALSNHDPFEHAAGLARGIVGRRGAVPFVAYGLTLGSIVPTVPHVLRPEKHAER